MSAADYERYRKGLEEQLRADVEMLYQAYLAKLRAYETISRAPGPLSVEALLPAELALHLPPAPAMAPAPAPEPQTPVPPRAKAYQVEDAVTEALDKLPEVFDKFDLLRVLDFAPKPATLHRALKRLRYDDVIAVERSGSGRLTTFFRKVGPTAPEGS
jgi:hypothetical protein